MEGRGFGFALFCFSLWSGVGDTELKGAGTHLVGAVRLDVDAPLSGNRKDRLRNVHAWSDSGRLKDFDVSVIVCFNLQRHLGLDKRFFKRIFHRDLKRHLHSGLQLGGGFHPNIEITVTFRSLLRRQET